MSSLIIHTVAKCFVLFIVFCLGGAAFLTWVERRMSAALQDRTGPNRANIWRFRFFGLLHPVADGIKMLFKEDFVPSGADRVLFFLAPALAFIPPLVAFMVIPFGPRTGDDQLFLVSNSQAGLLFLLAVGSLGIYGHTLAGWASDNKFSLFGALRSSAQLFSCEVGLTLSILGVFMVYGTILPQEIIAEQSRMWWGCVPGWGILAQPLGFLLFVGAAMAQTRRAPFDLPEADSEIVAGCSTEYSSGGLAMFFLSRYVGILLAGAFGAVLFLGGYHVPFLDRLTAFAGVADDVWWSCAIQVLAFLLKTGLLVYLQLLIRWTVPRMRHDQMMNFGWKFLIPFGLANLLITSVVLLFVR